MSASVNKVLLIGNLTRDPEVRYTPKGTAVCDLGLALNRIFQSESGERREETTFVDVTVWGKTAENAGEFLSKGRPVFVEGRLQMDSWEDRQTGQKRNKLKVVADQLQFLGSRGDSDSGGGGGRHGGRPQYSRDDSHRDSDAPRSDEHSGGDSPAEPEKDDIPF